MVSHPETGSDSPIGSDRDRGRDTNCVLVIFVRHVPVHVRHVPVQLCSVFQF